MRTKTNLNVKAAFLVLIAVMLVSFACTRVEDNTRSASLLVVESIQGIIGQDDTQSTPLLSDTCDNDNDQPQDPELCGVFNDSADIDFANQFLQVGPGAGFGNSFLNDIVVNRYRVDYFRPNGRNTPGVDVPYGIDGTMNIRVPVDGTATAGILVVRHESKREPPLSELDNGTGEDVITAQAEIKFFGQDLAGRTVSATGFLEIHFGNFGEAQ
jgi:hypothetical protein